MSYYPILSAPGCEGWTTLCNFAPNNWEVRGRRAKRVTVSWASEGQWRTETLGTIRADETMTVSRNDLPQDLAPDALPLLAMTSAAPVAAGPVLPASDAHPTVVPAWRATLGLSSARASTSYQGEVDPFPPQASLLTFCPLLQFGDEVETYLLFVSVERAAAARTATLEVYDAATMRRRGTFDARSNALTVVPLDGLGFSPSELPMILCRDMAGVPLYFSRTRDFAHLSLEHTHPPASYVVLGKRWEAQKALKEKWFGRAAAA